MLAIVPIETPTLGNRSYLAHDGENSLVVDPPRDVERVEAAAARAGVRIAAVAETHVHNDFVSGARRLATRHRAEHVVAAAEQVDFPRAGVREGDKLQVGLLNIEVLATPGHTPEHLAFLAGSDAEPAPALFSGGSLLFGTVGRTDLVGAEHAEPLARAQHRSVRRLAERLPPSTRLFPTHGFGSFCASTSAATDDTSTLAAEVSRNPALHHADEDAFVAQLLAGFGPIPAHYAHMDPLNRTQDLAPPAVPRRLPLDEVRRAVDAGHQVVDLRDRTRYATGHLEGSLGFEYGAQCATYVGWVLPWAGPLVLVADTQERVDDAVLDLYRIGRERIEGTHVMTETTGTCNGYRRARWPELVRALATEKAVVVLDVRRRDEHEDLHVQGSTNLPLHELAEALHAVPPGQVWVHCKSGYRASIAAGLLHRESRDVVLVDDDLDLAREAGVDLAGALRS